MSAGAKTAGETSPSGGPEVKVRTASLSVGSNSALILLKVTGRRTSSRT